jgi:DNA-3-methyladenine glycosylase I
VYSAPDALPGIAKEAVAMSKELRSRGFTFVGPTTAYAFMQAMGLVNDHVTACTFRESVQSARRARLGTPK